MRFTPAMPSDRPVDFIARWGANDHVLVAEIDGRVVGYAGLHVRDGKRRHSAWLGIAVHDEFPGRGCGVALMKALLELADKWIGLVRVDLEAERRERARHRHVSPLRLRRGGAAKKAYFAEGGYGDAVLMARVR